MTCVSSDGLNAVVEESEKAANSIRTPTTFVSPCVSCTMSPFSSAALLLLLVALSSAQFQLDPKLNSVVSNGVFFSPTVTRGRVPLVFKNQTGAFVATPGYYVVLWDNGVGKGYWPAQVWSNDPATLQTSGLGGFTPGSVFSLTLFGAANSATPISLANWTNALINNVTQPYPITGISFSQHVFQLNQSSTFGVTINVPSCSPQPSCSYSLAKQWVMCVFYYMSLDAPIVPGAYWQANFVSNLTAVNDTFGTCTSPSTNYLPNGQELPFTTDVALVSYDSLLDTSHCALSPCDNSATFWAVSPTTFSPSAVPCFAYQSPQPFNFTATSDTPLQLQSHLGHTLDYGNKGANTIATFAPPFSSITVTQMCSSSQPGGNSTQQVKLTVYDQNSVAVTYPLYIHDVTVVNIFANSSTPASGPAGSTVTILGTFWTSFEYQCSFGSGGGGVNVTATNVQSDSISCQVPSSSPGSTSLRIYSSGHAVAMSQSSFSFQVTSGSPTSSQSSSPSPSPSSSQSPTPSPSHSSGTEKCAVGAVLLVLMMTVALIF